MAPLAVRDMVEPTVRFWMMAVYIDVVLLVLFEVVMMRERQSMRVMKGQPLHGSWNI